jgi:hypothetical protein
MKSQDILLLLKIHCVDIHSMNKRGMNSYIDRLIEKSDVSQGWQDEQLSVNEESLAANRELNELSMRHLSWTTGISKSEISSILQRSYKSGLAFKHSGTDKPAVNKKALKEFLAYGAKYVFPAESGKLTRGIPTAAYAPVMDEIILSLGEIPLVWPDPFGNVKGESLEPIYKTVPMAVKRDLVLYELLALLDVIRVGTAREIPIAQKMLMERLS